MSSIIQLIFMVLDPLGLRLMKLNSAQQQNVHQEQIPQDEEDYQLINTDTSTSSAWEELKSKYLCTICQDVIAVPKNLNCLHSYCGSCLHDHFKTSEGCDTEDSDVEDEDDDQPHSKIISFCPTCRVEINMVTFVRCWAEDIDRQVEALPECEGKRGFRERKERYQRISAPDEPCSPTVGYAEGIELGRWITMIMVPVFVAVLFNLLSRRSAR